MNIKTIKMRLPKSFFVAIVLLTISCSKSNSSTASGSGTNTTILPVDSTSDVSMYLTEPDKSALLKKQNIILDFATFTNSDPTIEVTETDTYQTIDGFGYALTGGSASLINQLPATDKAALLKELFLTDNSGIGISYLRISIGASDMSAAAFTYDDLATAQTDSALGSFSIDAERTDLIPLLKQILAINPSIKILGSPWSAPAWMKTNNSLKNGSLKPECYDVYARYFVKYIKAFKAEGINIDAITTQNEPLNANNNPSMVMQATEQIDFIKNNLGPQFKTAGISTKIIAYDHNADKPEYPIQVLQDTGAAKFIDGSAFHLYNGAIAALSQVHMAAPNKNIYFTEQYTSNSGSFESTMLWHITNLVIGATRNWSRNVLEWNLASDASWGPHTVGGCSDCMGALTIGSTVTRNVSYYIIGHASKFVMPGSIRIGSTTLGSLPNVAFKRADGKKVLIVMNTGSTAQKFNIKYNGKAISASLNKDAVATFIW